MVNYQNVKQEKLGFALAASMALHLLAIWPGAFSPRTDEAFGNALSVVLRPQAGSAGSETARLTTLAPAGAARAPEARSAAIAVEPVADVSPRAAAFESAAPGVADAVASRAGSAAAQGREAAQAAAGTHEGADADGVRQYRMALKMEAGRFKRYPPRALADEIGGTVEIRVAVAVGGTPQEIVLARSSGHESLDQAALEMLRKAAPRTAVPDALRRRAFAVNLPVVFDVASE